MGVSILGFVVCALFYISASRDRKAQEKDADLKIPSGSNQEIRFNNATGWSPRSRRTTSTFSMLGRPLTTQLTQLADGDPAGDLDPTSKEQPTTHRRTSSGVVGNPQPVR